jgi:hypothetical protein
MAILAFHIGYHETMAQENRWNGIFLATKGSCYFFYLKYEWEKEEKIQMVHVLAHM